MHFEGQRHFSLPVAEVARPLSDASFLLNCLDQVEEVLENTPDRATWKLRTGFSFLSTSLETTLTVVERVENEVTRFRVLSKGVGASSVVEASLHYSPEENGTKVTFVADITERTGFLKIVSKSLIQAAAGKVIEDTWNSIAAKLK